MCRIEASFQNDILDATIYQIKYRSGWLYQTKIHITHIVYQPNEKEKPAWLEQGWQLILGSCPIIFFSQPFQSKNPLTNSRYGCGWVTRYFVYIRISSIHRSAHILIICPGLTAQICHILSQCNRIHLLKKYKWMWPQRYSKLIYKISHNEQSQTRLEGWF